MEFLSSTWIKPPHTSFWLHFQAEARVSLNLILHVLTWNNSLPDISPAKMGLFRSRRELQFGVSNHSKLLASPSMAREGEHIYRGEKEVGRAIVNRVHGFSLAESSPGRKRSLSFSCCALLSSQGMRALPSGLPTLFNWGFCLLIFYIFPLLIKIFLWSTTDQVSGFLVSVAFCPLMPGGAFAGCGVSHWRESTGWKPIEITFKYQGEVGGRTFRHF